MGGIGVWQLLIVLLIVLLLFGSKRIRQLGGDVGGFMKGLRDAGRELEDMQGKDK
jgi:sec-independent protein translocase protein TatA